MRVKRLFYYLLINIIVSASTVLLVLYIWDQVHQTGGDIVPKITPNPVAVIQGSPAARPTASPTSVPATATPQTYKVKPGETLGEIADAFGVSLEELLEVNGRSDPNSVGVGEVLIIPAPEEPPASASATSSSAQEGGGSEIPDAETGETRVEIVSVIGVGDLASERVLLKGSGTGELSLAYWQLKDESGNAYTFPAITLFADGAVYLHTAAGVDSVVDLYWGQAESVWESGEKVTLLDADGQVRATYRAP
jgi:LysM repeat protein